MLPLVLAGLGLAALAAAALVLRSFGSRYRVGRLLATAPRVSVAEALEIARSGTPRYVRIDGRIDAEDEFEDHAHRPLVFRRTRLETLRDRRWVAFEDSRETVEFEVREGLDAIGIDANALDDGLVVLPRLSVGKAADIPDRVPADLPPDAPVRVRIEQVSSVEHATVLGVPRRDAGGLVRMTAADRKPLVFTTLASDEAMRVLAEGGAGRPRIAAALLLAALGLLAAAVLAWALGAVPVLAATPTAAPTFAPGTGGDPRSEGEGPGLVGDPGLAILAVAVIGVAAVLATLVWIRLTGPGPDSTR